MHPTPRWTASLALLVAASSASAPVPAHPAGALASIKLDPVHSVALFRIQHLGAGQFWGRFKALDGTVKWELDSKDAPQFDVTAQVKNADTGAEKLDGNLQGPNFFNAKEFPTIRFESSAGTPAGERHWTLKGALTLHGVTKPVEVDCVATGIGDGPGGKRVGFECTCTIKRSEFGMKWGIEKPAKALGDEVRLVVALEGEVAEGG